MKATRTSSRIKPGERGSKKLLSIYGNRLVCVRYRYDAVQRKRYKTVELIIEEGDWIPRKPLRKADDLVELAISLQEVTLQSKVRRAGGIWNQQKRVLEMRYDKAVKLGVTGRIVKKKVRR